MKRFLTFTLAALLGVVLVSCEKTEKKSFGVLRIAGVEQEITDATYYSNELDKGHFDIFINLKGGRCLHFQLDKFHDGDKVDLTKVDPTDAMESTGEHFYWVYYGQAMTSSKNHPMFYGNNSAFQPAGANSYIRIKSSEGKKGKTEIEAEFNITDVSFSIDGWTLDKNVIYGDVKNFRAEIKPDTGK